MCGPALVLAHRLNDSRRALGLPLPRPADPPPRGLDQPLHVGQNQIWPCPQPGGRSACIQLNWLCRWL